MKQATDFQLPVSSCDLSLQELWAIRPNSIFQIYINRVVSGQQCLFACWLVCPLGLVWNIWALAQCIAMSILYIHGPQRMNSTNFDGLLTFPPASPWSWLDNYWMCSHYLVFVLMVPSGWILITLVIYWLSMRHHGISHNFDLSSAHRLDRLA